MDANDTALTLFTTRVRQMILQYNKQKEELSELQEIIREKEENIKLMEKKLQQQQNDYNSLKIAKMVEITDGDMEEAQKRLSKLIRDVNKCITLLSEKQ